ncbi:hypothetical protein J2X11_000976 [Aeromicrobium panaciterrae]|uniref:DUF4307 domain-containing protein n=1 Tax=Aeromicrobium panaciterrae TaxID=363861 RepID=A0ABU1ULU7_9ACTN|nr:DUF4307 domain-containing protein [Aeromicrobium panaciterrae]MDR7086137.1 hypothetical protein [Aeromicrobium panaciterrae]
MTDLGARYGTSNRPRWFWPLIAAIGITIGIAFAAWVGFQDKPITARVWGYDVVDDHNITIKLDVVRPDPLDIECTVYAQAADHSIVGEKTVELPAIDEEEIRLEVDIETERRAVTGVLRTCVAAE